VRAYVGYFIMTALWNRAGYHIFILWFLSSIYLFFSSPNLSGRTLDVYHSLLRHMVWHKPSTNLESRSETAISPPHVSTMWWTSAH